MSPPADATTAERDPLDLLAEEFVARHRRGESPSVSEYAARFPDLADQIRQTFPAALMMERLKPSNTELASGTIGAEARPLLGLERLGDYRILGEIGRGGMGVVYEAEQVSLGRRVALKVLSHQPATSPTILRRFELEARAAARLHHTNIVPVFGVGEENGVHYYVMQFIRGQGLDAILEQLPRDAESPSPTLPGAKETYFQSVAWIGVQVADALQYAHDAGVLHRDVKPSNLMLDAGGRVWVTDFGLAKLDDQGDLTRDTDVIGTLRYMAPERFAGRCDAASDVYSLGLVLYEMLSLRPAYRATSRHELIRQISSRSPPPPRHFDRRIPRDLETIVLKAMSPQPTDRYASAADLGQDLRRFLEDKPIHARRVGLIERSRRWARRNPMSAVLIGCVAALLVAVSAASLVIAGRFGRWAVKEAGARADADTARKTAEATLAELYPANGLAAGRRGNDAEAALWFASAAMLVPPQSEGAKDNLLRARLCSGNALTPVAAFQIQDLPAQPVEAMTFHPSKPRLMIARRGGGTEIWDLARERPVVTSPEQVRAAAAEFGSPPSIGKVPLAADEKPAWTTADAAGRRIAVAAAAADQAKVFDAKTTSPIASFPVPRNASSKGVLSPDGMLLLVLTPGRSADLWSLASGGRAAPELDALVHSDLAAFSPDGRLIVTHDPGGLVRVWALPGPALPVLQFPASAAYAAVRFDRSGRYVMVGGGTAQARAPRSTQPYDLDSGASAGPAIFPAGTLGAADFSADARTIVTASAGSEKERTLQFWDRESGQSRLSPVSLPSDPIGLAYAPGGASVAVRCAAGEVLVVDAQTAGVATTWRSQPPPAGALWLVRDGGIRWTPGGSHLVTWGTSAIEVWDPRTGEPRYAALKHESPCGEIEFARQGNLMASASWDGTVRVWDLQSGQPAASPLVHGAPACSARFIDDDRHLLTQAGDGSLRIWDWKSNRLVHVLSNDSNVLRAGASGEWAIGGTSGRGVRLWDLRTRTPVGPAIPTTGMPLLIDVAPGGRFAAVMGGGHGFDVVRLDALGQGQGAKFNREQQLAGAELIFGRRLERGSLVELSPQQWLERWRAWRSAGGADEFPIARTSVAWHRQQAATAAAASDDAGQLFHLRRLADARAANWAQYARAGQVQADAGRWAEAADMLAAAVDLQPGDARLAAALGDVRLGAGNWVGAQEAFARAARLRGATWVRGNWWICGPYPGALADVAPPEGHTSVSLPVEPGQSEKRWRLLHGGGGSETSLDFHSHFNWAEHVLGYTQTFVYSEKEQPVTLVLGSDDAMRLWLNGRDVFEHKGFLTVGQGRVEVTLAKGWNQLLAKVANDRRHHRLHLQIVEARGGADSGAAAYRGEQPNR